jgi:hypothetical protein
VTTTIVTNTGEAQVQLLQIANQEGRALARAHTWQRLTTETSFTTVATEQQTGHTLPTDLGWIIDETLFNRTTTEAVYGPLSSRMWQEQKAYGTSLTWSQYRLRGNSFYFLPAPSASQSVYYEYVSNKWCETSGGSALEKWAADTDVGKLDEYVMTLGVVWRWNKSKGLAYEQEYNDYMEERQKLIARDGTRRTLSVGGPLRYGLGRGRIPEGSWA